MSHVEQVMLSGPKKFCSRTMGGKCKYNESGVCKMCGEPKDAPAPVVQQQQEEAAPVVEQVMQSGPKKFCSRTMGGKCKYNESGVCKMCGEHK